MKFRNIRYSLSILMKSYDVSLILCLRETPTFETSTFASSEDPDEMLHKAAFHLGLHCLQE